MSRADARELLREWISSPKWKGFGEVDLDEDVQGLIYACFKGEEAQIDQACAKRTAQLINSVLHGRYETLVALLTWAERILPRTHTLLLKALRSPQHRSSVIRCLLQSERVSTEYFERPPKTKTEKFLSWLLNEALMASNIQAVVDFVWRFTHWPPCGWLNRLRKAGGAAKVKQLLNHPRSIKHAKYAFFNRAGVVWGHDPHGDKALTEALQSIREEAAAEVMALFRTVFSDPAIQKRLAERLSIVPKDEPGLTTLWKELAVFIPDKQLNVIKRSVGTGTGKSS